MKIMKSKITLFLIIGAMVLLLSAGANAETVLKVTGIVNHPLGLTMTDLERFQPTDVQINDIKKDGSYQGVFNCRGISLSTLLGVAEIEKRETDFKKQVDVAVIVKSRTGKQITLSWGEIFYKYPDDVIVAISSSPIYPHKGVDHFADKAVYEEMMKTLNRDVGYPRLIVRGDLFSDRSIESVSEIVVVDVKPKVEGKKSPTVYSENFQIVKDGKTGKKVTQMPEGPRGRIQLHIVGEGRGYHGTRWIEGVSFKKLLEPYSARFNVNTVFIVSAPDAYRSLISYGELYLNPHGDRIMMADKVDGTPIDSNGGRFILHLPDDLMADREIKAVSKIEIMNLD